MAGSVSQSVCVSALLQSMHSGGLRLVGFEDTAESVMLFVAENHPLQDGHTATAMHVGRACLAENEGC